MLTKKLFNSLHILSNLNKAIRIKSKQHYLFHTIMVEEPANKLTKVINKTIGTHDGVFHCDEVLACFMLQQLDEYKNATVVRTRDLTQLETCDIVVDVGGVFDKEKKRFDHHQREFNDTLSTLKPELPDFNIKLSSAGLIYCYYGEEVIKQILKKEKGIELNDKSLKIIFKKVYEGLIREIDGIDNGVPMFDGEPQYTISTHLSARVSHFNQEWNSEADFDALKQFQKAQALVGSEFLDKIFYYVTVWLPARELVVDMIKTRFDVHKSGEILEMKKFCPWKVHLSELEEEHGVKDIPKYVLYTDTKGSHRVICVPVTPDSFVCRKFLHKDWRGIRDDQLKAVSGIADATFCHATGFIGGAGSREGALQMAIKSLEFVEE